MSTSRLLKWSLNDSNLCSEMSQHMLQNCVCYQIINLTWKAESFNRTGLGLHRWENSLFLLHQMLVKLEHRLRWVAPTIARSSSSPCSFKQPWTQSYKKGAQCWLPTSHIFYFYNFSNFSIYFFIFGAKKILVDPKNHHSAKVLIRVF